MMPEAGVENAESIEKFLTKPEMLVGFLVDDRKEH
jgi:hypothetical protein